MRKELLAIILAAALLPVVAMAETPSPSSPNPQERADAMVRLQSSVFRHTLLQAKDLPDIGMLPKEGSIIVRKEIGSQGLEVDPRSLPDIKNTSFVLMTKNQIQEKADRDLKPITYVVLDSLEIYGAIATVSVGTDMALPKNSGLGKLCCCVGSAVFNLIKNDWVFSRWKEIECA